MPPPGDQIDHELVHTTFGGANREDIARERVTHFLADDGAAVDVLNNGHDLLLEALHVGSDVLAIAAHHRVG